MLFLHISFMGASVWSTQVFPPSAATRGEVDFVEATRVLGLQGKRKQTKKKKEKKEIVLRPWD